jgi:hypothetical protein
LFFTSFDASVDAFQHEFSPLSPLFAIFAGFSLATLIRFSLAFASRVADRPAAITPDFRFRFSPALAIALRQSLPRHFHYC